MRVATLLALAFCLAFTAPTPAQAEEAGAPASEDAVKALTIGGQKVMKVSVCGDTSAAITADGSLWMWGENLHGNHGNGTSYDDGMPTPIPRRVPGLSNVVDVSIGDMFSGAVTADGSVYTWGLNDFGRLGDGTEVSRSWPQKVEGLPPVASLSLGYDTVAAIARDGSLYMWGDNQRGELGLGWRSTLEAPHRVEGLPPVVAVAPGFCVTVAATSDGSLYQWGDMQGLGWDIRDSFVPTPQRVPAVTDVVDVSVTNSGLFAAGCAALTRDGALYTWGGNHCSQLGRDGGDMLYSPERVEGIPPAVSVEMGFGHACVVTTDGDIYLWGYNNGGQLGNGHTGLFGTATPMKVSVPARIASASLGFMHSAVVTADGDLYAWGDNSEGQLGDGSTTSRLEPILVFKHPEPVPVSNDPDVMYVYRMYNVNTGEHLYTTDANEANTLQSTGWTFERVGWSAPKSSGKPIYRLFNQWSGEHLYTTDRNEYDTLVGQGWNGEGEKIYSADSSGVPTYRLRNPLGSGVTAHHYTTDANERDTLTRQGWIYEDVCWYGLR